MQNNINIGININDGGTGEKVNKVAKEIKGNLEGAAAAAKRVPEALAAAKMGIEASNAMRSSGPARATRAPTGATGPELKDYSISRGISGATGAASRDFAAQAQGLGGLVQVYATFAANLFAVSAAFTALSKAADTTNMVKGLDQLGAASGVNLGSLSKKIAEATDGAVSLREAMTAAAQASAGGMSSKNIERLAQAAKLTSQALGVSMPDALSRLSRGITKIEPELLDELGILVKVDKASQDYARTLGKTSSQLTDFEKRQGFANAVLTEAEQKFGSISMDANPYSKLSASLANLAQSGLEVVNKVATPLLNFLASSPTSLALVISGIATILLRQAIPALTQWREGLDDMAQNAAKNAAYIKTSFEEFQIAKGLGPGFALEKEAEKHRAAASEMIKNNKLFKASSDIAMQASSDTGAFSAKNLSSVKSAITGVTKEIETYNTALKTTTDPKELEHISSKIAGLSKTKDTYAALGDTISKSMKAAADSVRLLENAETDLGKKDTYLSEYAQRQRNLKSAEQKASSAGVLSQVGKNTEFMGIKDAFTQMWSDITKGVTTETGEKVTQPLEGIRKYATAASGSVRILASAGMTLISSLGTIGMVAGVLTAAFGLLSAALSKNEKEMLAFNSALEASKSNIENTIRVSELLAKQDPLKQMSIANISAVANAFNGLSESLSAVQESSKKALSKLTESNFDTFTNWVSKAWGGDIASKTADSLSSNLTAAFNLLDEGPIKENYKKKIASILNINIVTPETVKNASIALSKLDPSLLALKLKELNTESSNVNTAINNSASNLNAYKSSFDTATKASQDFIISLSNNDPLFKYGVSLTVLSDSFAKLSGSSDESKAALLDLLQDTKKLSQFSEGTTSKLLGMKDAFLANAAAAKANSEALKKVNKDVEEASTIEALREKKRLLASGRSEEDISKLAAAGRPGAQAAGKLINAEEARREVQRFINKSSTDMDYSKLAQQARGIIDVGMQDSFMRGADLIDKALGSVTAKAAIEISKAAGVGLTGSRATEQGLSLVKQEVALRITEIELRKEEILRLGELNNTMQLAEARRAVKEAETSGNKDTGKLNQAVLVLEGIAKAYSGGTRGIAAAYSAGRTLPSQAPRSQGEEDSRFVTQKIAQGVASPFSQTAALNAAKISESAKITSAEIAAQYKLVSDKSETKLRELKTTVDIQTEEANRLTILDNISGGIDLNITKQKIAAQNAAEAAKQESDNILILDKYTASINLSLNEKLNTEERSRQVQEAINTAAILADQINSQIVKNRNKGYTDTQTILKSTLDTNKRDYETLVAKNNLQNTVLNTEQQIAEARYNAYASLGGLTEVEKADAAYSMELAKAELSTKIAINAKTAEGINLEKERADSKTAMGVGADTTAFDAETTRQQGLIQSTIAGLQVEGEARKTILGIVKESSTFLDNQTDQMNKMVSVTESLSSIFGELGTNIGNVGQAILKMAQDDETYLLKKKTLEEDIVKAKIANNPEEEIKLKSKLGDLDKKQAKDEIINISKVAGASKKMFSEKTAGYKVLNGIEKAMAAFTLAMQVKEAAMDIKNFAIKMGLISQEVTAEVAKETAQFAARAASASADVSLTVSTEAAKNAAKTPGVFMSFMNWLGPWGMAAAGVAIAAVLGGGGGGAKVNTAGLTSEDMQKSQGTGQKWVDGKLVDTGGGVFGDSEAKSNSLLNSINLIKENQIEGLSYDNKSLSILESIDKGIEKTAIALYQTQGISTGSGFGTNEAFTSNAGFLGLFASSSSTEIINSGIKIGGTLANATAQQFEDVLKTKTKSGFLGIGGGTSQSLTNNIKDLNNTATEGLQEIFTNMGNLFVEQGKQLGMSTEDLKTSISSLPIEVTASLQGLKGKELREELGYVLSGIADDAANKLFPALRQYRQFGEGMSETVTRVLDSNNKYKLSLASIGIATNEVKEELLPVSQVLIDAVTTAQAKVDALKIDTRTVDVMQGYGSGEGYYEMLTTISDPQIAKDLAGANSTLTAAQLALTEATGQMTTKSIGLSETLIKNAGGLEQFLEKIKFFGDNFLTEADRLAPKQKAVTEEMARLGYSSVDTREEFKTLVKGLDLTTAAGQTNYQALMNVAESFDAVTSAAEAAAEKTRDLQKGLLSAQGKDAEVLAMDRAEALADKNLTTSDALILKATYAQEDLNKTEDLTIRLMTVQGKSLEVLALTRAKELKGLSATDAAIQTRIWMLQDEKAATTAATTQQITLLGLLGMSEEALALTRSNELANMEESLRPRQKYIYALQDENTIREKLKSTLKTNSDSLKGFINTLKTAKDTLLLGTLTTLTPEQRYQEAKSQKDAIARAAVAIAVTDSEIATRNDAISKLPSVTNTFLEASRELYASSAQYTEDFNSVLDLLDLTSDSLIDQATVADNQLTALTTLSTTSTSIEQLTRDLLGAQTTTNQALLDYIASGTTTTGKDIVGTGPVSKAIENMYTTILGRPSDAEGKAYWVDTVSKGTNTLSDIEAYFKSLPEAKVQLLYKDLAGRTGEEAGVKYWADMLRAGAPNTEVLKAFATSVLAVQKEAASDKVKKIAAETDLNKLVDVVPGFAKGGLASGVAVVGEQGPELVDFATPSRVYSNRASNDLLNNRELIAEIRNLRKEVAELRADQREQTGHLIASNYDANSANAKEIAKATEEAAQAQVWSERSKVKLA